MAKQKFVNTRFTEQSLRLLKIAERVTNQFRAERLDLTVRQMYYQYVSNYYDSIPDEWADPESGSKNNEKSYKNIVKLISKGRKAGLLDWDMFTDRVRVVDRLAMWDDPEDRLHWAAKTHRLDKWDDQPNYVMGMIEKQALEGILFQVCRQVEIPAVSNHGFSSDTLMYEIGREFHARRRHGQEIHVIYLGDHDPSGMNMGSDIKKRLEMYSEGYVEIHRVALTWDQVQQYNPPPNPTKPTDSRTDAYEEEFGEECWELDALTPTVLRDVVRDKVEELRDEDIWNESLDKQEHERELLMHLWERVVEGDVKLFLPGDSPNGKTSRKKK